MYLSDEIASLLIYENDYQDVLKVSEQKVTYERSKNATQTQLKYEDDDSN